jgi:hypothetical protein
MHARKRERVFCACVRGCLGPCARAGAAAVGGRTCAERGDGDVRLGARLLARAELVGEACGGALGVGEEAVALGEHRLCAIWINKA